MNIAIKENNCLSVWQAEEGLSGQVETQTNSYNDVGFLGKFCSHIVLTCNIQREIILSEQNFHAGLEVQMF